MFTIDGEYIRGGGGASGNLKTQLPLIAKEFPEVSDCYHGTINLRLGCLLLVVAPDHRTQPIKWAPDSAAEVFDFVRIKIEAPTGSPAVPAWLYVAHGSPHRVTPHVHEVIAAKLPLELGMQCRIIIDRPFYPLPFTIII